MKKSRDKIINNWIKSKPHQLAIHTYCPGASVNWQ